MALLDSDWELDEAKTLRAMLVVYMDMVDTYTKKDKMSYISREEYYYVTDELMTCLKRIVSQNERFVSCMETLTSSMEILAAQVIDIKKRLDEEGI